MSNKDSPTLREAERRASESLARARTMTEVLERYLRKLRC